MSNTPDFDVDLLANIDVPSTRQLSLCERTDSIKVMHDDLMTLAENDGCIAAAWALDAIQAMAAEIRRSQTREQQLTATLRSTVKAMEIWGDIEDGIPRCDESGTRIRPAYKRAKALLDTKEGR